MTLLRALFGEKIVQKLEKTERKKHTLEIDTNSRKKEGNVLDIEQCQRKDLSRAVLKKKTLM